MTHNQILPTSENAVPPLQWNSSGPHRILVADGDISIRRLSTEVLVHSGYVVDAVADGAAAWHALNADRYHLLIADHNLPKLTGVELLKKTRAAHMDLSVILLSGLAPSEEFTRYSWLRSAATLLKPYTFAELLGTVKEILREPSRAHLRLDPSPNQQSRPSADRLRP